MSKQKTAPQAWGLQDEIDYLHGLLEGDRVRTAAKVLNGYLSSFDSRRWTFRGFQILRGIAQELLDAVTTECNS